MPISQRSDAKRIRAPRWPRGLVPWKMTVQTFLEKIAGMVGAQIEIIGADRVTMGPDGSATFNVPGGAGEAAGCEYAWTPTFVSNVSSNDRVTLNVGTFNNNFLVTIDDAGGGGDTDIMDSPPPQLAIPDTGTQIVYLEVTGTKTKTANNFVTGFTPSTATIEVSTSVPSSTQTVRRLELFRWSAGALVSQARKYNLILDCRDDGTSTDVGVFNWLPGG